MLNQQQISYLVNPTGKCTFDGTTYTIYLPDGTQFPILYSDLKDFISALGGRLDEAQQVIDLAQAQQIFYKQLAGDIDMFIQNNPQQ